MLASGEGQHRRPILAAMDVGMIVIGDEVLSGQVVDRNGVLVANAVRERGHRLRALLVVPDDVERIAAAVRWCRSDGCSLILTSGGVGPTHDDRTMPGVAAGLDLPLEECGPMRARVDGWILRATEMGVDEVALGAEWLRRMALVPRGMTLFDVQGPAFELRLDDAVVVVLPGPPDQFASAFETGVCASHLPVCEVERAEIEHAYPESMLSSTLADLEVSHPEVNIGSYPGSGRVLLRLSGPKADVDSAVREIRERLVRLELDPSGRAMRAAMRARTRD